MTDARPCILGCTNRDGIPYRAAPGRMCCHPCAEKLRRLLDDISDTYARVTDIHELIPSGHGNTSGPRRVPGPRSPAVDDLLVHTDVRSILDHGPAALATVESWARMIREERSIDTPPERMRDTVPAGRVTMERELATIKFEWDWVLAQPWLDEFAAEMRAVHTALQRAGRDLPPVLRIGPCPTLVEVEDQGAVREEPCGAPLRVRVDDEEIRCRSCGTIWPRSRWRELGDPWTDYATLADDYGVPVGTLWRWASEDGWRRAKRGGRLLVHRDDAEASRERRQMGRVA
ncbi:MAG: hypothetical protein QJR12_16805 [Mycobacterium sp.]|uniref:hypothetical protein n=1 Tax=Mycobacterium sp. TaxID=1785 RepID=UPI0026249749|nr:hypothetical protein [Mycobacterium sp.]MDI3315867.1 hypothetical protein [Mycobacterium sp.]